MTNFVTDDYKVVVDIKEDDKSNVYRIINTEFDVVEYEDYLLPRVLDTIVEMQEKLTEKRSKFHESLKPAVELKLLN